MKYTEIELQYKDIMWFGVDRHGRIFECTTGGVGCVPLFVIDSKEETDLLEDYFLNALKESTHGTLYIPDNDSPLAQDCKILSKKGAYCFDVAIDDERPDEYKKIASPDCPIKLEDLPKEIKSILEKHFVDVDVFSESYIEVSHGK